MTAQGTHGTQQAERQQCVAGAEAGREVPCAAMQGPHSGNVYA